MSPLAANERRLHRARRALYGARSYLTAFVGVGRRIRVSPEYRGLRWTSAAIAILFLIQMGTGILLSLYYYPEPGAAYASMRFVIGKLPSGWLVRAAHHWAGDLLLAGVLVHVVVVFARRAYAPPRHLQWVFGFVLLQVMLGFRFTGRFLPWDNEALEGARRGLDLLEAVPVIGPMVSNWLRGGGELGAKSLSRFYTTHILILPWAGLALVVLHAWFLRRHGLEKGGPK